MPLPFATALSSVSSPIILIVSLRQTATDIVNVDGKIKNAALFLL